MSRTHDVSISAFDLERIEKSAEAWQSMAHQLASALEACDRGHHPTAWRTHARTQALEAYWRLRTGDFSHES